MPMDKLTDIKFKDISRAYIEKPSNCLKIYLLWPAVNKRIRWLILSLVFFYTVSQYYKPALESTSGTELWLRRFVADNKLASRVQLVLGDEKTKKLAVKINQQLNQFCRVSNPKDAYSAPVYVITPTYRRPDQIAHLTRLAQTLMHVPNIIWFLVEDATEKSTSLASLLKKWGIRAVHLIGERKPSWRELRRSQRFLAMLSRGVNCRNRALTWIRENATDGVLYFADDDNAYSVELFEEIRTTKKVSMFPVGMGSIWGLSSPIVSNGTFVGFYDEFEAGRKFRIDMAGFAVNVKFFKQRPNARMMMKEGQEEESFLQSLAPFEPEEVELKADNCTKILVWHTKSKKHDSPAPPLSEKYQNTNLVQLRRMILKKSR